jgi:predicted phosphate transport protein (TIGR00153 family)
MKKQSNNYFEMFVSMAEYSCRAVEDLHESLVHFDPDRLTEQMARMHEIEHTADNTKHELMQRLSAEFLPPIEREDIIALANEIDEVTDSIEDVLLKMYMYNVTSIRQDAIDFVKVISDCCHALKNLLEEFRHFKKSDHIQDLIIEINRLENEGDNHYTANVHNLFVSGASPLEIFVWTEMFSKMEKCCDACEHTANVVESVIMKNS